MHTVQHGRLWLAFATSISACYDGLDRGEIAATIANPEPDSGSTSGEDGGDADDVSDDGALTSGPTSGPTSSASGAEPADCVPGQENCACLDGACAGGLGCVDEACLPGPSVDLGFATYAYIPGMRARVQYEVVASEYGWAQIDGPAVDIPDPSGHPLYVDLPPDSADSTVTLRLTAVRNTIEFSHDLEIQIVPAIVHDPFADTAPPPLALGATAATSFTADGVWIALPEQRAIARVDRLGAVLDIFDVDGAPASLYDTIVPGEVDRPAILFADPEAGALKLFNRGNQQTEVLASATTDGEPVGPVRHVIAADKGDAFFCNGAAGQVFYYDWDPTTETGGATVVLDSSQIGSNPQSLALRGEELFVGTAGEVWRVRLDGAEVEAADLYLDLGDAGLGVDGLTIDRAANLIAGVSSAQHIFVARHVDRGAATVSAHWDFSGNPRARFAEIRHGGGPFDNRSLYLADGAGGLGVFFTGEQD